LVVLPPRRGLMDAQSDVRSTGITRSSWDLIGAKSALRFVTGSQVHSFTGAQRTKPKKLQCSSIDAAFPTSQQQIIGLANQMGILASNSR
jgi:hypothetical protein